MNNIVQGRYIFHQVIHTQKYMLWIQVSIFLLLHFLFMKNQNHQLIDT
jgi:hypothetical protein